MPLKQFEQLKDETRLVRYLDTVYKVKIKYQDVGGAIQHLSKSNAHVEIEAALRAILHIEQNKGKFLKIKTQHFVISPKKCYWKAIEKLGFMQDKTMLKAHPFLLILTIRFQNRSDNYVDTIHVTDHNACVQAQDVPILSESQVTRNGELQKKHLQKKNVVIGLNENTVKKCHVVLEKLPSNVTTGQYSVRTMRHNSPWKVVKSCSGDVGGKLRISPRQQLQKAKECITATKPTDVQTDSRYVSRNEANPVKSTKIASSGIKKKHKLYTPSLKPLKIVHGKQTDQSVGQLETHQSNTVSRQKLSSCPTLSESNFQQISVKAKPTEQKHSHSHNESRRLQNMTLRNSFALAEKKTAKFGQKDRYSIQLDELEEDRKLENLAKSLSPMNYMTRKRKGIWDILDTFTTPIKKLLKR